jgi:hypothetical protein
LTNQPRPSPSFQEKDIDPHCFCTQVESKKANDKRLETLYPEERLAQLSRGWYGSAQRSAGGVVLDDAEIRDSGAIDVAAEWLEKTCLPELPGTTSLVDCTLGELRRVLAALHVHSLYPTKLEDVADDHQETRGQIASYLHSRPFDDLVAWLANLAGVRVDSTKAIVSVLTFDPIHPHVTPAEQPFVRAKNGQLFVLPRMLLMLDLPRMYAGAINKTKAGHGAYERVVNDIENAGVATIAADMCKAVKSAAQVVEKATFRLPTGAEITPDLIVTSDERAEVLVIDVKHALPPLGPLDVRHDVKEATAWKKRMAEYVSAIDQHPEILSPRLPWNPRGKVSVVGLILLRWPVPIPIDFVYPIHAVDWLSLREHLLQSGVASAHALKVAWRPLTH